MAVISGLSVSSDPSRELGNSAVLRQPRSSWALSWPLAVDLTAETLVTFRPLTPRDLAWHIASGEWEGRAGGYAIQRRGATLVERIEGDYLNVVGLPAALLVRTLAERFPGIYGVG